MIEERGKSKKHYFIAIDYELTESRRTQSQVPTETCLEARNHRFLLSFYDLWG